MKWCPIYKMKSLEGNDLLQIMELEMEGDEINTPSVPDFQIQMAINLSV